jgi:hypothetical protein
MSVKDHVEEIKSMQNTVILSKRKEEYHAENPDTTEVSIPFLKVKFDQPIYLQVIKYPFQKAYKRT